MSKVVKTEKSYKIRITVTSGQLPDEDAKEFPVPEIDSR